MVVLNADDTYLSRLAVELEATGQRVIRCSASRFDADIAVIEDAEGAQLFIAGVAVGSVPLGAAWGSVALSNVACAVGVGVAMGVERDDLLEPLRSLPVAENRLAISQGASGATILDDTFNSNPRGARLALTALALASCPGQRCVVVSPGMVELGSQQYAENVSFAAEVARMATDFVIVGRTNRKALLDGARVAALDGVRCSVHLTATRDEAVELIRRELGPGDAVLYENDLPDHYA